MICLNCRKAGEENSLGHLKRATHWHEKCEYKGDCGCHHKVGPLSASPLLLNPTGNLYPVGLVDLKFVEPGTLRNLIGIMKLPHQRLKMLNWHHLYSLQQLYQLARLKENLTILYHQ